jgi:hypothetical protein
MRRQGREVKADHYQTKACHARPAARGGGERDGQVCASHGETASWCLHLRTPFLATYFAKTTMASRSASSTVSSVLSSDGDIDEPVAEPLTSWQQRAKGARVRSLEQADFIAGESAAKPTKNEIWITSQWAEASLRFLFSSYFLQCIRS